MERSLPLATAARYHRTEVFGFSEMYDFLKVGDRCPDKIFADDPNSSPILEEKGNISMIDDEASSSCFLDSKDFLNNFNYPVDSSLDASQDNKIQSHKDHFMGKTIIVSHVHEELEIGCVEEVTSTEETSTDQYSSEQYSTEQNSSEESSNEQPSNEQPSTEQQCREKREKKIDSLSVQRKKTDTLPQRHKHNAKEYKCPECPYSCTVYEALINHQATHSSGNPKVTLLIRCKICGEVHSSRMGMEMHMKTHKINGSFFCFVCNWSSPQLKNAIQHRRIHASEIPPSEQPSTEEQCREKRGKKVDSLSRLYFCPFDQCSYQCMQRDQLDRHVKKHVLLDGVHPNGKKRKKTDTLPQRHKHNAEEYKCPECPYSCTVYEAFINHQAAHASRNTNVPLLISCKICGEDHSSRRGMEMHMKTHKVNGNFYCDVCNWSSPQLKKVIQHRRIHTSEKPHLCPHCNYRTSRRDNLRSHIRRMHNKLNVYIDTFNPN